MQENNPFTRQVADVKPAYPAKVWRPTVVKQRFSRTAAEAAEQDGVDTSVIVKRAS